MVSETLANPKSWTHNPQFAFTRVDAGSGVEPDFRVSLTSPMTVREGCGYDIPLEASCYNPAFEGLSRGCSSTRPAGCAARCRSRATSAPTGST